MICKFLKCKYLIEQACTFLLKIDDRNIHIVYPEDYLFTIDTSTNTELKTYLFEEAFILKKYCPFYSKIQIIRKILK